MAAPISSLQEDVAGNARVITLPPFNFVVDNLLRNLLGNRNALEACILISVLQAVFPLSKQTLPTKMMLTLLLPVVLVVALVQYIVAHPVES